MWFSFKKRTCGYECFPFTSRTTSSNFISSQISFHLSIFRRMSVFELIKSYLRDTTDSMRVIDLGGKFSFAAITPNEYKEIFGIILGRLSIEDQRLWSKNGYEPTNMKGTCSRCEKPKIKSNLQRNSRHSNSRHVQQEFD